MTKKVFVLDFYDTPLDKETLNPADRINYSVNHGNKTYPVLYAVGSGNVDALLVEPRIAFYSPTAKRELGSFLEEMMARKEFPIIVVSTEKLEVINQNYQLEEGKHYHKYICKKGDAPLEDVKGALKLMVK